MTISNLLEDYTLQIANRTDVKVCYPIWLHAFFFISINIFQPSLKLMLNLSRFQPQNMLMLYLKVKPTRDRS